MQNFVGSFNKNRNILHLSQGVKKYIISKAFKVLKLWKNSEICTRVMSNIVVQLGSRYSFCNDTLDKPGYLKSRAHDIENSRRFLDVGWNKFKSQLFQQS